MVVYRVTQGGDKIDDTFGCTTTGNASDIQVVVADTYNTAGGSRINVVDNSGEVIILSK